MPSLPAFAELAAEDDPPLDLLALALAAEFRDVDAQAALAQLDELGEHVASVLADEPAHSPSEQAAACARVLGAEHGFAGDADDYDHPDNSMLDRVLERRRGLPILLSIVYAEAGRRAGLPLVGVGLPGHYVVGHFGAAPPVLLDPFAGGRPVEGAVDHRFVRPWRATETAMRMLNNLVAAHQRRGSLAAGIHAARLRLALPTDPVTKEGLTQDLRAMQARLN